MSAVDWKPGPRLKVLKDADKALPCMVRDELGGYSWGTRATWYKHARLAQ